MKIITTNECPLPMTNGNLKTPEGHLPIDNGYSMEGDNDCNNSNNSNLPLTNGQLENDKNSFVVDEEDGTYHLPLSDNKNYLKSKEEYPDNQQPNNDMPFSFPTTAPPDVIAELTSDDDLNAQIQNLADQSVQQTRARRKSGRLEVHFQLDDLEENKLNTTNFFAIQPVVSQWLDHTNSPSTWLNTQASTSSESTKIINSDNSPLPHTNAIPKIITNNLPIDNDHSLQKDNLITNHLPLPNDHVDNSQNDFDLDEDDTYLPLPTRDEYPARRHRSIDIPIFFPSTNHQDGNNTELTGDELNVHLQKLAEHTTQQQRPTQRLSGRQRVSFKMDHPIDSFLSLEDDSFAFRPNGKHWNDDEQPNYPSMRPTVEGPSKIRENDKEKTDEEEMEKVSVKVGDMSLENTWAQRLSGRQSLVRQHLLNVENRLFEMFGHKDKQTINVNKFLMGLMATGLRHSDPRLKEMRKNLKKVHEKLAASDTQDLDVDYETFMGIISDNLEIVVKAFSSSFVIPDFTDFCQTVDEIYATCQANTDGTVASYIPQLARSNPDHWGASICTVDGQRHSLGDVNVPFTLQSCSKPLNYALALGMTGTESIHGYVGMEPSGRYFNELCLDYNNKPHNPMINAGAIMTASLIKPNLSAADRFDYVFNLYKRLVAGEYLGFNNAVFLSERECADRNFALAYFMRENKCFPEGTRLHETLDFYFQLCSLEITAESGALIAATLANGGINPLTGDPVLTVEAVRNTLTLMHSCGMYNYSGQFAFKVGLPSKSGVSGCVLVVVPNTMGVCLWSPPLDSNGNSCRSVQFCMELVSRFTFHNFDNLRGQISTKTDPRVAKAESKAQILFDLLFSAAAGDLSALRRHSLSGTDMESKDYDGRTALHVAASEGHYNIVEYLLRNCQVCPIPKDRWDRTPLDDARVFGHPRCATIIEETCTRRGLPIPPPPEDIDKD